MKRLKYAVTTAAFALLLSLEALASTASISFSDPSVTAGSDVNVTMKVSSTDASLARADVTIGYDASLLEFVSGTDAEGGAGTIRINGATNGSGTGTLEYNLKFHTLSAGTATLTVQNYDIYDSDEAAAQLDHQGSSTVTIAAEATASKDAQLSSLVVSPGTLEPAFSADVNSYTLTVGSDVDTLAITALAADSGASVEVSGNDALAMGENTVNVTVTAADGSTKSSYTLLVTKQEGGPSADDASETVTTNEGVKLSAKEKTITIMNPGSDVEIPEGFAESTIDIDGHQVKGWVWKQDAEHSYVIVYGMNEAGELAFYRYDLTEKTLQRYFEDPVEQQIQEDASHYTELVTSYDQLVKRYNHMFILTCGLAVVVLVLLVAVIILNSRRHKKDRSDMVRRLNKARDEKAGSTSEDESDEDLEETIPLHKLGDLPGHGSEEEEDADPSEDLEETRVLDPAAFVAGSDAAADDIEPTIDIRSLGALPTQTHEEEDSLGQTRAIPSSPKKTKDSSRGLDIEEL